MNVGHRHAEPEETFALGGDVIEFAYRTTALIITFAASSAAIAAASAAPSMLRHRLAVDCALGGVGIILAATPESRNALVAIIVPEFDGNTRITFMARTTA